MATIPIHALFAEDNINPNEEWEIDPRQLVDSADVVLAVDVMTGNKALVYGRSALEEIAQSGKGRKLEVLEVELDMETDELERLLALMRVMKGHDDYQPRQ